MSGLWKHSVLRNRSLNFRPSLRITLPSPTPHLLLPKASLSAFIPDRRRRGTSLPCWSTRTFLAQVYHADLLPWNVCSKASLPFQSLGKGFAQDCVSSAGATLRSPSPQRSPSSNVALSKSQISHHNASAGLCGLFSAPSLPEKGKPKLSPILLSHEPP